jgi:hypothetical protein
MPKTAETIGALLGEAQKGIRQEWDRLATLDKKIQGKLTRTWMPANADSEYKDLFTKASTPWLVFIRDAIAQGLRLDGYASDDLWRDVWQANGMDGRQGAVHREVAGLGKSFLMVLPRGDDTLMRPLSALKTYARYSDPWEEFPDWALHRVGPKKGADYWNSDWYFIDDVATYRFSGSPSAPRDVRVTEHNLGYCPVIMLSNTLSLDGEPVSSVEGAIPVYQRIVDATFTLQMVQRYGAFPQKWMSGGEIQTDANGNALINVSADSLIHAKTSPGSERPAFGSFQAANLTDVVAALDAHIKHLSAITQVPPHYLLGSVVNLSADALAAAESGYFRNVGDRQDALGEGYELAFRTAAAQRGMDAEADDVTAQVHWVDASTRSLGQISDAIVKLKTVDAPVELLFALVPGWTKTDVMEASAYAREREQAALPTPPAPPAEPALPA